MGETLAELEAIITADDSGFQSAMDGAQAALGALGDAIGAVAEPLAGVFNASISAAADHQVALVKLDAQYKAMGASTDQAQATQGHWAETTELAGAKADKMRAQLETLNARVYDQESAWSKAKTHTASAAVAMDHTKAKIVQLTQELGVNTAGQKVWVDGTKASGDAVGHWAQKFSDTADVINPFTDRMKAMTASINELMSKGGGGSPAMASLMAQAKQLEDGENAWYASQKVWVAGTKDMADATRPTEQSLLDMADAMSKTTRFSYDAVLGAESMALPYTQIGKEVFPQLTTAAADVAEATGKDLSSSMKALAKATEDPIKGVTALKRANIMLTGAETDQIVALQHSGDLMGAQKALLADVEARYGGVAQAIGETFSGKMEIFQHALEAVEVAIGNVFLPVLSAIIDVITQVVNAFSNMDPTFTTIIAGFAAAGAAVMLFSSPLMAVIAPIAAIGLAVAALDLAWENDFGGIQSFVTGWVGNIKSALAPVIDIVQNIMGMMTQDPASQGAANKNAARQTKLNSGDGNRAIDNTKGGEGQVNITFLDKLSAAIATYGPKLMAAVSNLITTAFSGIETYIVNTALPGLVDGLFTLGNWVINRGPGIVTDALKGLFNVGMGLLDNLLGDITTGLTNAGNYVKSSGPNLVTNALKALFTFDVDLVKTVSGLVGNVVTWLAKGGAKEIGDALVAAFAFTEDMGKAIVAGITNFFQGAFKEGGIGTQALNSFKEWWSNFFSATGDLATVMNGIGKWVSAAFTSAFSNIANVITQPFRDAIANIAGILSKLGIVGGQDLGGVGSKLQAALGGGGGNTTFHATGGNYGAGTPFVAGEWGRELVMPSNGGSVFSARQTREMMAGGGGSAQHFHGPITVLANDPGKLYEQLQRESDRHTGM